jgi:hypothetical protein
MTAEQETGGWWIRVESNPGFTDSSDVLRAVSEAMARDETLHSATVNLFGTGVLRAEVTVEEPRQMRAVELANAGFRRALEAAGMTTEGVPGPELNVEVIAALPAGSE